MTTIIRKLISTVALVALIATAVFVGNLFGDPLRGSMPTAPSAFAQVVATPGATQYFGNSPFRTLDTRTMAPHAGKKFPVQQAVDVCFAEYTKDVVVNLTATNIDTPGFLTAWPKGQPMPNSSNLNYSPAVNPAIANQAIVPVAAGATWKGACFSLYSYGRTDVLVDTVGTFI